MVDDLKQQEPMPEIYDAIDDNGAFDRAEPLIRERIRLAVEAERALRVKEMQDVINKLIEAGNKLFEFCKNELEGNTPGFMINWLIATKKLKREQKIRKMVRNAVIYAIEEDLNGGENLIKEVNEECNGDEEFGIIDNELEIIVALLKTKEMK